VKKSYKSTRIACYAGYFVQAIINNLSPVLFIIYQDRLGITYSLISCLIVINFLTQLVTDVLCVRLTRKFGERKCVVAAHVLSAAGLVLLGILPNVMPVAFLGLVIATLVSAVGSGMIEVLISPIVSNLPSDNDMGDMSFLHSFYCWGQMAVVLFTTLLLALKMPWWMLPFVWSVIPFINLFSFLTVPIIENSEKHEKLSYKTLFTSKLYMVFLLLMLCAGAGEMAMSQWASLFVEKSLGIPKAVGDILGPCMFALFMGVGRIVFGILGNKLNTYKILAFCSVGCFASYIISALSTASWLSLFSCALCGFSVSIMWPGVFSTCADAFKSGSTAMFAFLALFGDMGCASGPAVAGFLSELAESSSYIVMDSLKFGLLFSAVFPLIMFGLMMYLKKTGKF